MFSSDKSTETGTMKNLPQDAAHPEMKYDKQELIGILASVSTDYVKENALIRPTKVLTNLSECACRFMIRTKKNKRRVEAEAHIIKKTKALFPLEGEPITITYLSLGPGMLLQDFIICARLLLEGYSLCIRLVDHGCKKGNEKFMAAYKQFCCLQQYAQGLNLKFTVEFFPNILEYIKKHPEEKIDIGQAIDFDPYFKIFEAQTDLYFAYQVLSPKGFFYFSIFKADYIFDLKALNTLNSTPEVTFAEFFDASEVMNSLEKEVSQAIDKAALPKYVVKNILSYVGLFDTKDLEPSKPALTLTNADQTDLGV